MRVLGPGLITGASDDDPSGIGTYAQIGAAVGYASTWTLLFSYPLMSAIQVISARLGRTTGQGIAGNLRQFYPPALLHVGVALLLIANTINIGADIGAMADASHLLVGGPQPVFVFAYGVVAVLMQVCMAYKSYAKLLRWLTLALLAYVATLFFVHIDWLDLAANFFIPRIAWTKDYLTGIVAILGTTISPYLFFWQAAQEVEDIEAKPRRQPLRQAPEQALAAERRINLDTLVGMGYSNSIALAIMVAAAATLHVAGTTDIQTSAQAAEALKPIAGAWAGLFFALGIVGTGLLAVPVLGGSAAYAVAEAGGWPAGLDRKPKEARAFYATIAGAIIVGGLLNLTPISPIQALFWSAVVNGVVAVPIMAIMMLMATRSDVMGEEVIGGLLRVTGWITTLIMGVTAVTMIALSFA
jgi:NRAMP (natural resistance-associated macrophage protein)-like metal ion transporter